MTVNENLTGPYATQLAEDYFEAQGVSRYDLEAHTFLTALQELILTPDYFCSFVTSYCPNTNYEVINR